MRARATILSTLLVTLLLAGCSDGTTGDPTRTGEPGEEPLDAGRGGILGLLIDDVYRPIPGALILLQEAGLTATTDVDGQFVFRNLLPDSYTAKVSALDHEAAPALVEVVAGEYAELEIGARRIFSEGSTILTQQYSVFIACSAEALVVAATGINCNVDATGDSARTGFETDLRAEAENITYMITEVKFNHKGDYSVVIGLTDANLYETYYAEADVLGTDYVKIVNKYGAVNNRSGENVGNRNVNFTADPPFLTTIFPHGAGYSTFHSVCPPATPVTRSFCFWGAGPTIAVKANIIQSVFLGEPEVDLETYHVLAASA